MKLLFAALILLAAPLQAGLRVVATHSILGDWVRHVGGEDISLQVLVEPDGDAHVFQPTPESAVSISQAEVLVENGAGFEPWLEGLISSSRSMASRVRVSDVVPLRDAEGRRPPRAAEEADPHLWGDVANARRTVEHIARELSAASPENAAAFRARAAAYDQKLAALEVELREAAAIVPRKRRVLVTSHDSMGYWADAYAFTVVDSVLGSLSTDEGTEPSAAHMARLISQIRRTGVRAVFAENIRGNGGLMDTLVRETGVVLGGTLYTDALGRPGTPGEDYIGLMRYNMRVVIEALR